MSSLHRYPAKGCRRKHAQTGNCCGRVLNDCRVAKLSAGEDKAIDIELARESQEAESKTVSMVIWTAGIDTKAPDLYMSEDEKNWTEGLDVNGKLTTDKYQRIQGLGNCFAVGDAAVTKSQSGEVLPATAQVAFQQADYVAWNIYSAITCRQMLPFRYQHLGNMMVRRDENRGLPSLVVPLHGLDCVCVGNVAEFGQIFWIISAGRSV